MLRMQRNFGSSLNRRLAARKGLTSLALVLYPTGKSTDVSIHLVLREKKVRYCLRVELPIVQHCQRELPQVR